MSIMAMVYKTKNPQIIEEFLPFGYAPSASSSGPRGQDIRPLNKIF